MPSKRELILQQVKSILQAVPGINGRVYRCEGEAIDRDNHPCILLKWSSEQEDPVTVLMSERTLFIEIEIMVRGDEPDRLADPIACDVHSLLMADHSLNGLALDTIFGDARFEVEGADQTAGKLTHEYKVKFRHSWTDMTV